MPKSSQNKIIIEFEEEELYSELLDGILSFNNSLKPYFDISENFEDFLSRLDVDEANIPEPWGIELLHFSYECLVNNFSEEYIREHCTEEYTTYALKVTKYLIENPDDDGSKFFNIPITKINDSPCKWYQLKCHYNYFIAKKVENKLNEVLNGEVKVDFKWENGKGTITITITINI